MKSRLSALLLAALFACGGGTPASTTPTAPQPGEVTGTGTGGIVGAPGEAALPLWPALKKGVLPNGLTYYVLKHGRPEKRAHVWLAVNAGSTLEDDDQRGLAHFIEHMAFNGTKRFPKAAIVNYIESIGMSFGADLNASTSFDETTYKLTVPTDKPEFVGKAFDIIHDWAQDISFDPDELEKERGVVTEEWRGNRNVMMRMLESHLPVVFKGTKYATRLPIGLPEVLKTAKRDRFLAYYKDFYRPNLMAVIVVGDIDPVAIEKEIQTRFGDLKNPSPEKPRAKAGVPAATGTRVSLSTDKELPISLVSIDNIFPHRPEATKTDFRRLLVQGLYASIANERLATLTRSPEAPFGMAQISPATFVRDIDVFSRVAVAKTGRIEDSIRSLMTEAVRIERHGFTQGELDRARAKTAATYDQIAAEADTRQSMEFVEEITRNFYEGEFIVGSRAERDLAKEILPSVTLAELNTFAKSVGGTDNRVIQLSGPDPKTVPTEKRVLAIVDEVNKAKIDAWQETVSTAKLMATAPTPGKVTKETKIEKIGVTEWTLSNGVRVVLKPTDFDAEKMSITGDSPGGLAVADAKTFPHARFAAEVVGLGGLGELDDEALDKALAGKTVTVNASIGDTTERVVGAGSTRDMETLFQLVHLKMTAPRKDEKLFGTWKANTSEALENQRNNPETQFDIESNEVLWKKNPRRTTPVPADIQAVNIDKALAFYKDRFGDASDFTFVLVGAFDVEKVKPLVETYLGSLPAKGRKEKEKDAGIKRVGGVVKKTWPIGTEPKAAVEMQFYRDEAWSRDKDRDLYILGQVLDIRLREVLREDLSGTYGVGVGGFFARRPRTERVFNIQFGCAPEAVDKLVKAAFDEVAVVAKTGPTQEQLDKIKETFTREREVAFKSNGFWAGWLSSSYRFGDDPTLVLDMTGMTSRMTIANVKASAKKYVDLKQYFQAIMLPANGNATPATPAPAAAPAPAPAPKK